MPIELWFWVLVAWVGVNVWTFTMFAFDKSAAEAGRRRIPERSLLGLAMIGGSVGAMAGQKLLRHKTRKEPFRTILFAIAAFHISLLSFFAFRAFIAK